MSLSKNQDLQLERDMEREQQMTIIRKLNENQQGSVLTFKIKDSLYLGTSIQAFKDEQFILLNYIENIVVLQTKQDEFEDKFKELYGQENDQNVSCQQEQSQQQECIRYLHCKSQLFNQFCQDQKKTLSQQGYSQDNNVKYARKFQQIYDFIQSAQENGTSSLILSASPFPKIETTGYVFTLSTAYMMKKYNWSLYKSLEYMNAKHPNASISQESLKFLNRLEIQLMKGTNLTYNWDEWKNDEQLVIRNTFVNGRYSCWKECLKKEQSKIITKNTNKKSSSYLKKPQKNTSTQMIDQQENSPNKNKFKSILKLNSTKSKKNKCQITINEELNKIRQFYLQENCLQQKQTNLSKNSIINLSDLLDSKNHKNFNSARNQRISLSVTKLVAKFRYQKNQMPKNSSLLNSQNPSSGQPTNSKSLNKKQSFYNFQGFHKVRQTKKQPYENANSQTFNKFKTQNDIESNQKNQQKKQRTLPDQNNTPKVQNKQTFLTNLTKNDTKICSNSKQTEKNKSWLQIINRKRPSVQNSQKKGILTESIQKNKNRKENSSNCKNNPKQSQLKNYIKQVKRNNNEGLHQRKMSINQKFLNQDSSRKKDKNLIIEFQEFKQMTRKKQKSFGNLINQNIENFNNKQSLFQKDNKIASVIQKIKKESLSNQSSILNSRSNYNCVNTSKINGHKKDMEMKWR